MAFVIIADNQPLTRLAWETLLQNKASHTLFFASCQRELMALLQSQPIDRVVLDYTLFDFRDAESLLVVSERHPKVHWILSSDELTLSFLKKTVYQSHNFSVVFKDAPIEEIRQALLDVQKKTRYLCPRAKEMLLIQHDAPSPIRLTPTEKDILRCIALGKTTKEIAAERVSSVYTITTHRKNIFRKLGVNTAHEAGKYALRAGLVDMSDFYI